MVEAVLLVINADDFGLTSAVSEGILRAAREGVVTSTSVLAAAPAARSWLPRLADSGLPAGVHLSVVGEDPPLLTAREVPTLVDRHGRLALTWQEFLKRAVRGRVDTADLRREFEAQLAAAMNASVVPTHLDAHQNLHLWPAVGRIVVDLAVQHSIPVVRVPRTRRWDSRAAGVRPLGAALIGRARRLGLIVPDHAVGLDEAGRMTGPTLIAAVESLAALPGLCDLAVHPGADPDPDRFRYRWGYRWPEELEALCGAPVRAALDRSGARLTDFATAASALAR